MNKYFLKESIKLKCSLCYATGITIGMLKMLWLIYGFDLQNEETKEKSIKIMREDIKRLMDYINNDGWKK